MELAILIEVWTSLAHYITIYFFKAFPALPLDFRAAPFLARTALGTGFLDPAAAFLAEIFLTTDAAFLPDEPDFFPDPTLATFFEALDEA